MKNANGVNGKIIRKTVSSYRMNEPLLLVLSILLFILVVYILVSLGRAQAGEFHVNGPGEVYCAECGGECREIDYPQTSLKEFE